MKKSLILLNVLLFIIAGIVHGQTITQANTQFPNPGFEKWSNHNCSTAQGTSEVPDNWHTFDEVKYDLALGENSAKKTSHFKLTNSEAHGGSGNSLQLAAHNVNIIVANILANGTITSGRTRVGSASVGNYQNYNYSQLSVSGNDYWPSYGNHKWYWEFVGCPDSMSFYYKTNWTSSSSNTNKPLIKVYLHRGSWYDHANNVVNSTPSSSSDDITSTNLIAYCKSAFAPSSSWKRFTGKFIQYGNSSNNTDDDYSTITRPQYILASFSTNETAGVGTSNDKLSIDDLWCIYDKGLNILTIGGTTYSSALNVLNAAEYATHEPSRTFDNSGNPIFNNSGSVTWNYPTGIPCNNIPEVSATPKSKLISEFTITQATAENGYKATIFVKHNDNSTFYYYIQFTPALPTITLNNGGTYTACEGDSITVTASGASTYSWSNELGSSATVHPTAAGVYTVTGTASNGCTNTATATVTINTRPSVNITGPASLCQGTTGTLTATGLFVSCTWEDNSTNAIRNITPMNAGPATYSVTVTGNNSCTNTATKTVNVMANPSITTVSANTPCTGYDLILNAETETEDAIFAWSGPNDFTSNEQNPIIGNASTTMNGDYTVTVTDSETECSATDTVTVTVNQPTTGDTTATACESFDWYNHSNITESCSNLTHTLAGANINGCDSIVTLLLTINYGTYNAETDSAYESFTWHDSTYSTSGTYIYEYINADGCASTDTLHLTINNGTQNAETVIALNEGTTWVSFNVETNLDDLKAALVEAVPSTQIQIIGQNSSTTYNAGRWRGNLTWSLNNMYKIKVTSACEITLEGAPVDPADHPVTINSGNNWIAFPLNENMTPADAFAGFAVQGDQVSSQTGVSVYSRRWQGNIPALQPGKGYVYKTGSGPRTLVFPSAR